MPPHTQWFKLRDPHGPFRRCHPTPLFCELFSYRHPPLEERPRHALEPAPLVYPQDVSLDGDLGGHLSVMHSPEETTQQAGQVPAMQIEAAQRATGRSEASARQLRQVIVSDSDLHVSDRVLIVSILRVILTIEQLEICGIAEGVDHTGRDACLRMKPCEWC